jgi:hypothetical protein
VTKLMGQSDLVAMDLRAFTSKKKGCIFELGTLINEVPLDHVELLIDKTTDETFLRRTLADFWRNINPQSPRSWTQWEYYRATECEHPKPVYRFLAREDCAFDARPEEDVEKKRLQREHCERLRIPGGPIYYEFSTPQELQERILSIDEFRDTGRIPISHSLPFAPNPLFTGRDAELEALRQGLQQRRTVAVTQTVAVHGLGGVGKTQLAVQYAWKPLARVRRWSKPLLLSARAHFERRGESNPLPKSSRMYEKCAFPRESYPSKRLRRRHKPSEDVSA